MGVNNNWTSYLVQSPFSYIKAYCGIDTGNAEQVNAKVELNIFYLIVTLLITPVIEEKFDHFKYHFI